MSVEISGKIARFPWNAPESPGDAGLIREARKLLASCKCLEDVTQKPDNCDAETLFPLSVPLILQSPLISVADFSRHDRWRRLPEDVQRKLLAMFGVEKTPTGILYLSNDPGDMEMMAAYAAAVFCCTLTYTVAVVSVTGFSNMVAGYESIGSRAVFDKVRHPGLVVITGFSAFAQRRMDKAFSYLYELLDERRRLRRLTYVMDCPALGLLPTMQSGKLFGVPAGEIATAYLNLFPKDRNVSALLLCKNTYIVNSVAFS